MLQCINCCQPTCTCTESPLFHGEVYVLQQCMCSSNGRQRRHQRRAGNRLQTRCSSRRTSHAACASPPLCGQASERCTTCSHTSQHASRASRMTWTSCMSFGTFLRTKNATSSVQRHALLTKSRRCLTGTTRASWRRWWTKSQECTMGFRASTTRRRAATPTTALPSSSPSDSPTGDEASGCP
jgi:hypothetical protein